MYTVNDLRTGVNRLTRTLIAVKGGKTFDQNNWENDGECDTPGCVLGWGVKACPEALEMFYDDFHNRVPQSNATGRVGFRAGQDAYHLSWPLTKYLFEKAMGGIIGVGNRVFNDRRDILNAFSRMAGRDESIARVELALKYMRRRLAILEVEEGEWGRQKPAKDIPVGQEREAVLCG